MPDEIEVDRTPFRSATLSGVVVCDTVYVVGGLFGNEHALDAVEAMAGAEIGRVEIVFAGDAHLLDVAPDAFARLERRLDGYPAIRGAVERRLIGALPGLPPPLGAAEDAFSDIVDTLTPAFRRDAETAERLRRLPDRFVCDVGGRRIHVGLPEGRTAGAVTVHPFLAEAEIRPETAGIVTVFGGTAGIGNFWGDPRGVLTRVSVRRSPHAAAYGMRSDGLFVDALHVPYDRTAALAAFDAAWPSDRAGVSDLRNRMARGGPNAISRAMPQASMVTAA